MILVAVAVEAHSIDGFPKPFAFWTCLEGEPYQLQALQTRGLSCFPKVTAEKLQISWLQPIQYVAKLSKCCFLAVRCHYWHNQLFPRHQLSISNDIGEFWVGIFISQSCIDQGVNAYDQPDRKISFFFTPSPMKRPHNICNDWTRVQKKSGRSAYASSKIDFFVLWSPFANKQQIFPVLIDGSNTS